MEILKFAESKEELLAILDANWKHKDASTYRGIREAIERGEIHNRFHLLNSIKKHILEDKPLDPYFATASEIRRFLIENGFVKRSVDRIPNTTKFFQLIQPNESILSALLRILTDTHRWKPEYIQRYFDEYDKMMAYLRDY